jgi:MFS family permease
MQISNRTFGTRGRPIWIAVVALGVPTFVVSLGNLVMTFALPAIQAAFSATVSELQWVSNAYTLLFAAALMPAAAAGDRWGKRRVFMLGLAVFVASSLAAVFAGSLWALVMLRAVQGVGAAAVIPLALALLVDQVSERQRAVALGALSAVNGLGVALGPLVGGLVIFWGDWPVVFWVNVVTGTIALVLLAIVGHETPVAGVPSDSIGTLLVGVFVLTVGWAVIEVSNRGGNLPVVTIAAVIAVGAVTGLILRRRHPGSLVRAAMLRDRRFIVAGAVAFLFSAGVFGAVFALSLFIQVARERTALEAALWAAPWTLAPMIVAPLAGLIVSRAGARPVLASGLLLLGTAMGWFAHAAQTMTGPLDALAPALLAGLGMGMIFPALSTVVFAGRAPGERGLTSGLNSTTRQLGTAIGVATAAAVIGRHGEFTANALNLTIEPALIVCSGLTLLAAITAVLLPSGTGRTATP